MFNYCKILLAFIIFFQSTLAYINVYPYRVYLDLQRDKKEEEIIIYNKTNSKLRYKVSLKNSEILNTLTFYPAIVTLEPGDEKIVKLTLESGWEKLEKKEYASEILIEQLKVPIRNSRGEFVRSSGIEVYPKIKIPLRAYFGEKEIVLKKLSKTALQNVSDREINFEVFLKKDNKNKNSLEFLTSLKLKNMEKIELIQKLNRKDIDSIEKLEIYEKESGIKIKII